MLATLYIKNFAIIKEINLEFDQHLNIIVGETGAGKSIILDALQILLGDKASPSVIRQGESKSIIEGIFKLPSSHPVWTFLKENDLCDNEMHATDFIELIIRREINLNSSSRNFVNDTPIQLNILKQIGDFLIDFHGQYEHQYLLNPKNHITIVDAFCNNLNILDQYRQEYKKLLNLQDHLEKVLQDSEKFTQTIKNKTEDLEFINKIDPKLDEDKILVDELKIIENSEQLFNLYSEITNLLFENENSIINQLGIIQKRFTQISRYNPKVETYLDDLSNIFSILNEIKNHTINTLHTLDFQPNRIEEINQRLFQLQSLTRKYGSISEILEYRKQLQEELQAVEDYSSLIKKIKEEIAYQQSIVINLAKELSNNRRKIKKIFKQEIENLLKNLGFSYINFEVEINTNEAQITSNGIDKVEFFISTNKGENPRPLASVASGGETSRIMLALKSMAAKDSNLPILVFDEIDIGVSGSTSHKIAEQMKKLSRNHQIIAITHSPQVTSAGDAVFAVEKYESDGRTVTTAKRLNESEIISEISKFLASTVVSDIALENARQLRQNFMKISK